MSQRPPIFEYFTDLLPKSDAMKNGTVTLRSSRDSASKSSKLRDLKRTGGECKSKLKLNGVVRGSVRHCPRTKTASKHSTMTTATGRTAAHAHTDRTDHRLPPTPTSPSKRLCGLIDRLARRTSPAKSTVKRPRRNSVIFHEPAAKKLKLDDDSEPECSFEITETDQEMSDSQRLFTLAVAKIMNLEDEIDKLSKRSQRHRIEFTDESVRTYTGLPSLELFESVYEKIKPMVLKIRCKKDRSLSLRIWRKYRRIRGEFVRVKRLNLRDELMIALMHAKHDYDVRDTACRYDISVGQCRFVIKFWSSFLPYELEKSLLALSHLLPTSKWNKVPEYSPPSEPEPVPEAVPEPGTSDNTSKWTATPRSNGLRLVFRSPQARNTHSVSCPELRNLLKSKSAGNHNHNAVFRAKANYICKTCCLMHDSSLELLEHCRELFGADYCRLHHQLSDLMDMIDQNRRDAQELKCCVCGETRETLSSFLAHINVHIRDPPLKCVKCSKFFTKEIYDIHMKHFHPERKLKFFCTVCCIVFETKALFEKHNEQHNSSVNGTKVMITESLLKDVTIKGRKLPKLAPKPLVCNLPILLPGVVVKKVVTGAGSQSGSGVQSSSGSQSNTLKEVKSEPTKPEKFSSRVRHNCDKCNKVFYSKSGLDLHKIVHNVSNEERVQCPHCPRTFAHKMTLKVHMTQHTGEKPHKCSFCDKSFYRKNDLFNHERIHTGEKPYACQYCGAKFAHSCSLAAHVRQSCHKVPSKCEICGFVGKARSEFESHMKTHVSECNFRCNLCGKNFLTSQHLEQHQNIHLHKYPCSDCNAQFHSQKDLFSHAKSHVKDRKTGLLKDHTPNQCGECQRWFTRRSDLKRHLKRVHKACIEESPGKSSVDQSTEDLDTTDEGLDQVADVEEIMDGVMIDPLVIVE